MIKEKNIKIKGNLKLFKLAFLIILSFQCCTTKKNDSKSENFFKQKYNIKSKIVVNSNQLLDPTVIELLDSMIIISNYKGSPLIEIYDTLGKPLKKTINIGRGPAEIQITGKIQVNEKDGLFYVGDLLAKKVIECKPYQLFNNDKYVPKVIFNATKDNSIKDVHYDKILVGDSIFIGENRSSKGRLLIMDHNGNSLGYYFDFPAKGMVNSKLTDHGNASLYASAVTLNPKRTKLAMATYSAGMIDLIDLKDGVPSSIWSYNDFFPSHIESMPMGDLVVPVHTKESQTGYLDISATDRYVYALYSGKRIKEKNYDYCSTIRVMNWEANDFFELHLDRNIKRLAVSIDDKKIYGISKNSGEEPEIIVFNTSFIASR